MSRANFFSAAHAAILCVASARTFYVSSSKGSDANAGTSPASPLETLPFAVSGAAIGDAILLRMSDVFSLDAPLVVTGLGGGTLIGAYADGQPAASTPRPWIMRVGAPAAGPVVQFVDCRAGITVSGLEISGGEQGLLFTYSAPGAAWGGVSVTDNYLHDIRGLHGGGNPNGWGSCIGFNSPAPRTDIFASNVTIAHNLFNGSDVAYQNCITAQTHGGCVWPAGGSGSAGGYINLDGVSFTANLANHIFYNSAFFTFTRHTAVEANVFLDDAPVGLFNLGTTDIIIGASDGTLSFTGNEIANRGEFPGGPDGCGIDLEDSSDGVVLSGNYISGTLGAGIMVFAGTGAGNKNISLLDNTLLFDGCAQKSADHGVLAFLHAGQTGLIANNVLAACAGTQVYNGDTSGFILSNNTIYTGTAFVVATPVVSVVAGGAAATITATCATPGAVLRYTLDGSRVTRDAALWPAGGLTVRRATAVLVKAFANGLIESAVAGGVVAGAR